jgi:integrase/recombinase XerD
VYDNRIVLTLYRRHLKTCSHRDDRYYKRCKKCPMWIEGVHDSVYHRHSLKTASWDAAEDMKRELERGEEKAPPVAVSEATAAFLEHLRQKRVSPATIRKFEILLDRLGTFTRNAQLRTIDTPIVERFRNTWTWSALTTAKYIERLRRFWKFAMKQKWVSENPALDLEMPKILPRQVAPFEPDEVEKIEAEAKKNPRYYAMVLLLRHSGLRIADAVMLQRRRLKQGRLFLYTAKTGAPVWLPLPERVIEALANCPNGSHEFFFCTGEGKRATAVTNWRDDLARLFRRAGIVHAHPHRFRHTLAASLLEQGVPLSEVAMVLGNSAKVVEKHYAGWNLARQKRLEQLIRMTWDANEPSAAGHSGR